MKGIPASAGVLLTCSASLVDGDNPLLDAERGQSMTEVECLDAVRTVNVNNRDEFGSTPPYFAAGYGAVESPTAMVHPSVNAKTGTEGGKTPVAAGMPLPGSATMVDLRTRCIGGQSLRSVLSGAGA